MGSAALPAGFRPQAAVCPLPYRPRNPRATSLYPLLETHFETLIRIWEQRIRTTYRPVDPARAGADGEANEVTSRRALSRRWAQFIYRVYEVDPLDCPDAGQG